MIERSDKKSTVENICKEIEDSKGTHIWSDYVNALKLISQVIFTRSSGFILELIQNAEDSGLGLKSQGVFEISINTKRIKIAHNGKPFDEADIKALCGIRSSKKPEKGTLGYLGIGFKSVFKVTDCPEIYSRGLQFKFDRDHWDDPGKTPWHVIPIWMDKPSENIDAEKTTFIIPYREETNYPALLEEIEKIRTELYLFLRWLKKIVIIDEVSERTWVLENAGEAEDNITILKHGGTQQRFKFFRRTLEPIPDWVKQDRLTQEYRANVAKREIAIAFALDAEGNLDPSEAGAMYGGVYSFLPLGEAKSGAKFPIQADFLVQPGRDAINYEAKWNHWLLGEVAGLCREAIECFKKHDKWKYQFLPAFEFTKSENLEPYEKLFGPKLIEPIEKFLKDDNCIPAVDGSWAKPDDVVKITEEANAVEAFVAMNIFDREEMASKLGGKDGLKIVHPLVRENNSMPIRKVDRYDILNNETLLKRMSQTPNAPAWFRALYMWLSNYPKYEEYRQPYARRPSKRPKGYHDIKFVLAADKNLHKGGDCLLPDLPPSDPLIKELDTILQKEKPMLHPDILAGAANEDDQKLLRGFLTSLTGVQLLDSGKVCREVLLPKILTDLPKPLPDDLLGYTIKCREILGDAIGAGLEFWVLSKDGNIRVAKEVFFSQEFKPEENWEANKKYVSGVNFISPAYLGDVTDDGQRRKWREFFKCGGVKYGPDNGVEEFAMNYVEEKLRDQCQNIVPVDKRNFGYDLEAEDRAGNKMHIEVKGLSAERDVELTGNETDAADKHKDNFYLCVVSGIPETPAMYMVRNPAAPGVGKKDKLTIQVNVWKAYKR